ncbi:MAG: hypothetical protein M3256_03630 [Actinomycetota bacterium]|nr:hypothetical protein [Actinomycetota bacterium]
MSAVLVALGAADLVDGDPFLAADERDEAFLAADLEAGAFFAVDLEAVDLAADAFVAGDFLVADADLALDLAFLVAFFAVPLAVGAAPFALDVAAAVDLRPVVVASLALDLPADAADRAACTVAPRAPAAERWADVAVADAERLTAPTRLAVALVADSTASATSATTSAPCSSTFLVAAFTAATAVFFTLALAWRGDEAAAEVDELLRFVGIVAPQRFLAAEDFFAVVLVVVALEAAAFLAGDVLAGDVLAGEAFLAAVAFLAGVVCLAAVFLAAAFLVAALLALRASLKAVAALKPTPFDAATRMGWLVCGLRPVRAGLLLGLKVPNPKIETLEPDLTSAMILPRAAETAVSTCFFSSPVS